MQGENTITVLPEGSNDGIQQSRSFNGRASGPTRRSTKGHWTAEEDEILRQAVQRFKGKNWKKIADCFKDRTDVQCLHRWQKVLNPELVKGPWTKEEDEIIIELVHKYGPKKWSAIAQHLPGRIGKQCRERWHNHLNPAINKEAWTQEEELTLIRAHQVYGNRWAELTKFLPGRTDNGIKNHWNSSVKKKLDSYLQSGLLEQYEAFPLVPVQVRPLLPSFARTQSSGNENGPKGGSEAEESECTQGSATAGCSQSASDLPDAVTSPRESVQLTEMPYVVEQSHIAACCPEQYYTFFEGVAISFPDTPCEMEYSSAFPDNKYSHGVGPSARPSYQYSLPHLPNIELGNQSPGFLPHCMDGNSKHQVIDIPFQVSVGSGASASMVNMDLASDKTRSLLISDDECCRVLFPETVDDGCNLSGTFFQELNMDECGECEGSMPCQSSDIQISTKHGTLTSQSFPLKSDAFGASSNQNMTPAASLMSADNGPSLSDKGRRQLNSLSCGAPELECNKDPNYGFIYTNSQCDDDGNNSDQQEDPFSAKDSSKLVQVDAFASQPEVVIDSTQKFEPNADKEQQDARSSSYEPPHFPSLDIPFFSCDLIQSNSDFLQEYSPLGIRQLMMSSLNSLSPLRLWDSPPRDGSPDTVPKTGAKTFSSTPSILKKRNRDLLSPLSERRCDKKLETDMSSRLARDFSRLGVMFDDSRNDNSSRLSPTSILKSDSREIVEDKENKSDVSRRSHIECTSSNDKILKDTVDSINSQGKAEEMTSTTLAKSNDDAETDVVTEEQHLGVLIDRSINDMMLSSPNQSSAKADQSVTSATRKLFCKASMFTSKQGVPSEPSSGSLCIIIDSPRLRTKKSESLLVAHASPTGNTRENAEPDNNMTTEDLTIFGGTPFRKSLESPSAWKSPWYINSLTASPKFDTEITIEDIGYLLSPEDRSYAAMAFMKHLSEPTSAASAEVLEKDAPVPIQKQSQLNNSDSDKENSHVPHIPQEKQSEVAASNVLAERRVLDFSDCGTTGKGAESRKASTSEGCSSSSSSYLLKGYR